MPCQAGFLKKFSLLIVSRSADLNLFTQYQIVIQNKRHITINVYFNKLESDAVFSFLMFIDRSSVKEIKQPHVMMSEVTISSGILQMLLNFGGIVLVIPDYCTLYCVNCTDIEKTASSVRCHKAVTVRPALLGNIFSQKICSPYQLWATLYSQLLFHAMLT